MDQMISSQLGSLNTAAPAGPVWREPKQLEQMKDMEEGKKESDELAPMYVEGRTVQLDHQTWRQRAPMLVGGLLLLGLVVVLTQMPGGNTGTPGSQEMVDTKGEMGIAADASPVVQNFSSDEGLTTSIPSDEDDEAVAVGENSSANYTDTETENSLANYKASCPTLLKLHGACDYDLSVDDKNLQRHTLVRLVCPEQCQIMDRYRKMCPSLLNLEGGCVHDLAIEEKTLPQGTFVRLVCPDKCVESTTSTSSRMATTSQEERSKASESPEAPQKEPERPPVPTPTPATPALVNQTETIKIRPSRWLAYVVSVAAMVAWAGLCMKEYGWLRMFGR